MYLLPRGRKLIPIEEFITSRCPCKWQRNSSNPFIPTLLSLILTSLSLPSRSFTFSTPIEQFALPETSARSYEEKLPFLPSHSSLPTNLSFSLSLYTSGRCASFLPTVGKLALTRTTKECNQWGTRFRRHLSWNFQWRCSLRRIENREIRKRSRNLRLRQWRQLHWSSRRWCFPLPPLLPIIFYLFHFSSIQ